MAIHIWMFTRTRTHTHTHTNAESLRSSFFVNFNYELSLLLRLIVGDNNNHDVIVEN